MINDISDECIMLKDDEWWYMMTHDDKMMKWPWIMIHNNEVLIHDDTCW